MNLKILLPTRIMMDREVDKIIAEAANGSFGILPRHIDFLAALVPGILSIEYDNGKEEFLAIDEGILVKQDSKVLISTRDAVSGPELGKLREVVREKFETLDDQEKKSRTALAKL
ncbi:F0F1 ATP synthase subunit epsilon, partial [Candidatus Poribacteria bacterium]|nr:F0F1 ATP synthase subunit epsilon [Candidatus Poribacteria bacterium]